MARPRTLPDYLAPGLDIVSIGINPSLYSVERGFAFARPGNRFWPALNASGLVPEPIEPSRAGVERLFQVHRVGFTDVVKRPTAKAEEVTAAEFARGARLLRRKLERHRPRIAWFQGASGYRAFLEHALEVRHKRARIALGLQAERLGDTRLFVTPNPSGANPAANPRLLVPLFRELAQLRDRLRG
jgi:TDG/mug DNA glycosylase family protein